MRKRWKPENKETYWIVDVVNKIDVGVIEWASDSFDRRQYNNGNCFNTEAEARAAAEKVKTLLLSLHDEQPAKDCNQLPEWCKVGAIGFNDEYFKIIKINDKYCTVRYLDPHIQDEDGNIGDIPFDSLTRCHEARLRPYNTDEMKALVGKIVEHENGRYLVTACTSFQNGCCQVRLIDQFYSAEVLFEEKFYIDNSPCGVLEHLEDGEWVE